MVAAKVTACPRAVTLADEPSETTSDALLTGWVTPADVLPVKLPSPL
jgi:hypothetical protein